MREARGAFMNSDEIMAVDDALLARVTERALQSTTGRFRVCLHHDSSDAVQEMIIVQCAGGYVRPHRQRGYGKSYYVLDGRMTVFHFSDTGTCERVTEMAAPGSTEAHALHFPAGCWHSLIVRTPTVTMLEVLGGPNPGGRKTEYAPWSPEEVDETGVQAFLARLDHGARQ
jgi:cupin fold WbuC family metalloprotein